MEKIDPNDLSPTMLVFHKEFKNLKDNIDKLNETISKNNTVATVLTFVLIGIGVIQLLTIVLQLIYSQ